MRITYRRRNNKEYWTKRWDNIPADYSMENRGAYPLKFAELTVQPNGGRILEAGCGAGRILRYYADRGYDIVGIDIIKGAVCKLKEIDSTLEVETGDITNLRFEDESFRYVLAFGLYHNLQHNLDKAVKETFRIIEPGGKVCASFRADNLQTLFTDLLIEHRTRKNVSSSPPNKFHKMNLTQPEFVSLFENVGFTVESVYPVENMPFLYKFSLFRSHKHKNFNEQTGRKEGYKLSLLGRLIQGFLMKFFPSQFCNIFVLIARKPDKANKPLKNTR